MVESLKSALVTEGDLISGNEGRELVGILRTRCYEVYTRLDVHLVLKIQMTAVIVTTILFLLFIDLNSQHLAPIAWTSQGAKSSSSQPPTVQQVLGDTQCWP